MSSRTIITLNSGRSIQVTEPLSTIIRLWQEAVAARDDGSLDVLLTLTNYSPVAVVVVQTAHIETMAPASV